MPRLSTSAFAVATLAALAACGSKTEAPKGPVVAKGEGIAITADELKSRLDEQSPFVRARFATIERKKEFLDNLIRFELLAKEAEKQGLGKDPEVQLMMKRVMVQKLVQKTFSDAEAAKAVPDADVQAYYASHQDEFNRPARLRISQIVVKKEADAKKVLARVRAEEKKSPGSFTQVAREASEDPATKGLGGDLGFRTRDDLEKQVSKPAADAAFALADGQISDVVSSPQGFLILKRTGWQDAVDRPLDAVKGQIAGKLAKERRAKEFDEFVKRLRDAAKITVDEKELEKVAVAGAPGAPGRQMVSPVPENGAAHPAPSAAPAAPPARP